MCEQGALGRSRVCPGSSVGAQGLFTGKHVEFPIHTSSGTEALQSLIAKNELHSLQRAPTVSELFWFHEKGFEEFFVREKGPQNCAIVVQTALLFHVPKAKNSCLKALRGTFPAQGPPRLAKDSLPDESPVSSRPLLTLFCWAHAGGKNTPSNPRQEVATVRTSGARSSERPHGTSAPRAGDPGWGEGSGPWGSLEGDRDAGHRELRHIWTPGFWVEGGGRWPRWWGACLGNGLVLDLGGIRGKAEECGL